MGTALHRTIQWSQGGGVPPGHPVIPSHICAGATMHALAHMWGFVMCRTVVQLEDSLSRMSAADYVRLEKHAKSKAGRSSWKGTKEALLSSAVASARAAAAGPCGALCWRSGEIVRYLLETMSMLADGRQDGGCQVP